MNIVDRGWPVLGGHRAGFSMVDCGIGGMTCILLSAGKGLEGFFSGGEIFEKTVDLERSLAVEELRGKRKDITRTVVA